MFSRDFINRMDLILIAAVVITVLFGILMIYTFGLKLHWLPLCPVFVT